MNKIIDKKAMGKRLAAIRKELSITSEIAASYIGKEARTITAYESGQNYVSLEYLHELCIRHGVSADYAITGRGTMLIGENTKMLTPDLKELVRQEVGEVLKIRGL